MFVRSIETTVLFEDSNRSLWEFMIRWTESQLTTLIGSRIRNPNNFKIRPGAFQKFAEQETVRRSRDRGTDPNETPLMSDLIDKTPYEGQGSDYDGA